MSEVFKVVTPTYNASEYLQDALGSVASQAATGILHHHVQDGGSTDETLAILEQWATRVRAGDFSSKGKDFHFSYSSSPDAGMYDAINKGFEKLSVGSRDVLTWINADDRLAQGALTTVAEVLRDNPDCQLLSGRISVLTPDGAITGVNSPYVYTQASLTAGLHDGRHLPFIMQEGTFFTGDLWNLVSGCDTNFRLAGDWDLWRRMAHHSEHYSIDTITGFHRRHPGQLTESLEDYYAEVDSTLRTANIVILGNRLGNLVRYQPSIGRWSTTKAEPFVQRALDYIAHDVLETGLPWSYGAGFGPPEGPYPEYDLPGDVRWMTEKPGVIDLALAASARFKVRLKVRPVFERTRVSFSSSARTLYLRELRAPRPMTDVVIEFSCWLGVGDTQIEILVCDVLETAQLGEGRSLLIVSIEITTELSQYSRLEVTTNAARSSDLSRSRYRTALVVKTCNNPDKLQDTLHSLILAGASSRSIFVVDNDDPLSLVVARQFDYFIDMCTGGKDVDDYALTTRGYLRRLDIEAGVRLLPEALAIANEAVDSGGASEVRGLLDIYDATGGLVGRDVEAGCRLRTVGAANHRPLSLGCVLSSLRDPSRAKTLDAAVPRVLIHGGDLEFHRWSALEVAKAFALLGCSVTLSYKSGDTGNGMSISAYLEDAVFHGEIIADERQINLQLDGMPPITLPYSVGPEVYRTIGRSEARNTFDIRSDREVVAVFSEVDQPVAGLLSALAGQEKERSYAFILVGGIIEDFMDQSLVLSVNRDPDLRPVIVAAADRIVDITDYSLQVELEAAVAERLRVVGDDVLAGGLDTNSGIGGEDLIKVRNRALAFSTTQSVAIALRSGIARAMSRDTFSVWLSQRESLAHGDVLIKTDDLRLLRHKSSCDLIPISGSSWVTRELDTGAPESCLACQGSDVVFAVKVNVSEAQGLALRVFVSLTETCHFYISERLAGTHVLEGGVVHDLLIRCSPDSSLQRLRLHRECSSVSPDLLMLEWEVVASSRSRRVSSNRDELSFRPESGLEVIVPRNDGDWCRVEGFFEPDDPHPQFGLHEPFRWSKKRRFRIGIWSQYEARRPLVMVVRGNVAGQQLTPIMGEGKFGVGRPLPGNIMLDSQVRWILPMAKGLNLIDVELSSTGSVEAERELGVILRTVYIARS